MGPATIRKVGYLKETNRRIGLIGRSHQGLKPTGKFELPLAADRDLQAEFPSIGPAGHCIDAGLLNFYFVIISMI